jgi:anthranilate synthase
MRTTFTSRSGITVERREESLDYAAGLDFLIERLNGTRGAYFSSGVEDPDRYTRWDFGFDDPPLEMTARGNEVRFRALNDRGERLLAILAPVVTKGAETRVARLEDREIVLEVVVSDEVFPEEERSRQPSVFTPVRRLVEDFAHIDDTFLGLYGAFGYDLIFQFERMPLSHPRAADGRDLHLFLPDRLYLVDRRKEVAMRLDYEFTSGDVSTAAGRYAPFQPLPAPTPGGGGNAQGEIERDQPAENYMANVETARQHMHAGDIFEVVLSEKFSARYDGLASDLYYLMRSNNPSPYEFFIQLGEEQLIGASPEMFVRIEGDRVESSPISGTARRGENAMEDAERILALYNSEKDETELTMCTDVDRNDKSRICRPGTIKLLARRMIERYAGLFHTADHVEGRLRAGFTGLDAFLSHMWAVTLTGAPKPMAVRLIEAKEVSARGWYGGAIGAMLLNGDVNTGITIRTVHLKDGQADYRVGATIVYDSIPLEEERECQIKSTAFFAAMASLGRGPEPEVAPPPTPFADARVVMIDNEDSFVHTLADYFRQTGAAVTTYRAGVSLERVLAEKPDLVVHSPGPGRPADFGVPARVQELAEAGVPQFGVCLGLQGMVEAFGGRLQVLPEPRHGKIWEIAHDGDDLFQGVPSPCRFGAYHSLIVDVEEIPDELEVIARNEEGLVMAIRHRELPLMAVQFHPESILSMQAAVGHRIVENAMRCLAAVGARAVGARPAAE